MVFSRQDIHSARLIAIIFLSKDLASPSSLVLGFFPFTQGSLPSLRFANASKTADPSLRSGFRLRAPASLTPPKRLRLSKSAHSRQPRPARRQGTLIPTS